MSIELSRTGESAVLCLEQPPMADFLSGQYSMPGSPLQPHEAVGLFTYPDVPMSAEMRARSTDHTLNAANTVAYAQELQAMSAEVGTEKVVELATVMSKCVVAIAAALGIQSSDYASSPSWAIWDMAKQRRLAREQYGPNYPYQDSIGDMLQNPELRLRSIDRMLGWEIDRSLQGPGAEREVPALAFDMSVHSAIIATVNSSPRSAMGELSSQNLGHIGAIARNALGSAQQTFFAMVQNRRQQKPNLRTEELIFQDPTLIAARKLVVAEGKTYAERTTVQDWRLGGTSTPTLPTHPPTGALYISGGKGRTPMLHPIHTIPVGLTAELRQGPITEANVRRIGQAAREALGI